MSFTASPLAVFHPSNAVTFASLAAGLGAVVSAQHGHRSGAGALIALAVILDTFDGTYARSFARTPQMRQLGMHLDSLCDAVVFGIVPVACGWLLQDGGLGLLSAGGLYTACAIARLAHYNVTHDAHDGFIGLPVPVAALIWSTALLLQPAAAATTVMTILTGLAMVAPLPIPRPHREGLIAFACWPAIVCAAHALRVL